MKGKLKNARGITLIALVITIIVLLILAGVTIATLTGQNGILTRAQDSKKQTGIAEEKEAIQLAFAGAVAEKKGTGNVTASDLNREFGTNGTNATAEEGANGEITVTFAPPSNKVYTIDANGNISEPKEGEETQPTTGKTDGSYDTTKGVNTPKIDTENGMKLVKYNEETKEWVEDTTNLSYSYVAQTGSPVNSTTNEWANAKVTINGVESYFVWIPRYAYKIDSENKTIDVKFLKDTGVEATDGTICKYADDPILNTSTDYIIHPAFTTNADLGGGWDTELPGLWIGKYEAARSDSEGTTQGKSTTIKIQPNVTSWRSTTIGNMYTNALNYSTDLQSHMLKNSEWGAVAYLTHSQYGRNGTEIAINNSSNYITGTSGGSADASSSDPKYAYNDRTNGVLASSTGNVYGIYDLSGGAYEYLAGYYRGSTNGISFANGTSDAYSTAYSGMTASRAYKYGDATYETSGWNNDKAGFVHSSAPFFKRGGYYGSESNAGVFHFTNGDGYSYGGYGFRVCLAVQ